MTWIQDYLIDKNRLQQEHSHASNRLTDHRNKGALSLSKSRVVIEDGKVRLTPSASVGVDGSITMTVEDAIKLAQWIIDGPDSK